MLREDETWHRLREWTRVQASSERLAAQALVELGYKDLDPSHPMGGPDGGRDATCTMAGEPWIMAAYFPRGQQRFSQIRAKFKSDLEGATTASAVGIAFVTNQELSLAERKQLVTLTPLKVDLIHLERLTTLLDKPTMHGVRAQFLNIDFSNEKMKQAIVQEIAGAALRVEGSVTGGDTWGYVMLYHFDMAAAVAQQFVYIRKGEHPLYQVRTRILEMDSNREIRNDDWGEISAPAEYKHVRWKLPDQVYLRIFHHARNGQWSQDLILQRNDTAQCWLCATRVSDFQGNPRWIHIDQQFLELVGQPKWRA